MSGIASCFHKCLLVRLSDYCTMLGHRPSTCVTAEAQTRVTAKGQESEPWIPVYIYILQGFCLSCLTIRQIESNDLPPHGICRISSLSVWTGTVLFFPWWRVIMAKFDVCTFNLYLVLLTSDSINPIMQVPSMRFAPNVFCFIEGHACVCVCVCVCAPLDWIQIKIIISWIWSDSN